MELCNDRKDAFRGILSSFVFYFGKDIFHKVNRVASLVQTLFKVVNISSSNNALEEFV